MFFILHINLELKNTLICFKLALNLLVEAINLRTLHFGLTCFSASILLIIRTNAAAIEAGSCPLGH